jgi:two-component system, OmpR family, phosphate regulon response regulator OmpR
MGSSPCSKRAGSGDKNENEPQLFRRDFGKDAFHFEMFRRSALETLGNMMPAGRNAAGSEMLGSTPPSGSPNMEKQHSILVVDDDIEIRSLLERYLKHSQIGARTAADAQQMDRLLQRETFDCIILDLMMPGEDGLAICRRLRAAGNDTPIIMLTAKGTDIDRIIGLEMGADDYLAKPFNPRELLARINAVLRRRALPLTTGAPELGGQIAVGDHVLDLAARSLQRAGEEYRLTTGEFAMLNALVARPGRPLSREQLLDLTKGADIAVSDRSVDIQVHRLRQLVEVNPARPTLIQTVRGHGYVFVPRQPTGGRA